MSKPGRTSAARIVCDAGGKIVGRTRLQKIAYLMELAGLGDGFVFQYRHYGPYSEDLSMAIREAKLFDLVEEEERPAQWGGHYSIYTTRGESSAVVARTAFASTAARIGAIELELAATAAYLYAVEGREDPWEETRRRKPEKARDGRLERAKEAYQNLQALHTPSPLPRLERPPPG